LTLARAEWELRKKAATTVNATTKRRMRIPNPRGSTRRIRHEHGERNGGL
jgi:hypothetical protein